MRVLPTNPSAYITRPAAHATPRLIAYRKDLLAMKHRKGRSEQLLAAINQELAKRSKD